MELSDILNSLSDESTAGSFDKTASDNSHNALSNAIDRALESGITKQASYENTPSGDLVKMASRIADAENASLVKEAELYGAAVADGFMARMGSHGDSQDSVKLAFDQGYADTMRMLNSGAGFNKIASTNDGLVKQAAFVEGYNDVIKEAAFEEGYNDVIKEAAFEEGYNDVIKEAAFEEGYNDVIKEAAYLEKTAAEFEEYGYNYGNSILASI
jgi:hypothetical protein